MMPNIPENLMYTPHYSQALGYDPNPNIYQPYQHHYYPDNYNQYPYNPQNQQYYYPQEMQYHSHPMPQPDDIQDEYNQLGINNYVAQNIDVNRQEEDIDSVNSFEQNAKLGGFEKPEFANSFIDHNISAITNFEENQSDTSHMQTFIKKGDNEEDEDEESEEDEEEEGEEEEQDQYSGSSEVSQHKDKSINRSVEQVRNLMKNAEELDGEEQLDKSMSGNVGVIGGIKTKQSEPKSDQKKYSSSKNQYSLGFQMSHKANYPQMHYDQSNSNAGYGYRPGRVGQISGL